MTIPPSVRLVAVTKGRTTEQIESLIHQGQLWFGENRIEEILKKWPSLKEMYPYIKLQFIGRLQSNKVEAIVRWCDSIASLDRPSVVHAVLKALEKHPKSLECLVQVNVGREYQKGGVMEEDLDAFLGLCQKNALPISGLMAIPPVDCDPTPYFMRLKALCAHYHLLECSMGMSSDYEKAIDLGTTQIRIGRALFENIQSLEI